jgi:hypothetical protein
VNIKGLLVQGGSFAFRLGMPGAVNGLRVVLRSWTFGPIDVKCSVVREWDAQIVTIGSDYQPTGIVQRQPCDTEGGD